MTHQTQIEGNLTHDPDEVRYAGDTPVLNVSVAVNSREKVNGQWQDGEPTFYRVALWRDLALNSAETLRKGMSVLITGQVKTRAYEKDGEKRTSLEMNADAIGPSLRFQTAQVQRVQKGAQQPQQSPQHQQPAADPWAAQQPAQPQSQGWDTPATQPAAWDQGGNQGDQPPF